MAASQTFSNLYRKYPIATVCGGVTVLLLAAFGLRFGTLGERQAELETVRADAVQLRTNVRNSDKLEDHVKSLGGGLAKLEARMVKESELATNLQHFYTLEGETGVKASVQQTTGLEPRKVPAKTAYVPVRFSVAVDASYAKILEFLHALEHGPVEYKLVEFSVRSSSSSSDGAVGRAENRVALTLQLELLGVP